MRRSDPRIRQTLNQISNTLETANLNTQASLFSFSEAYIQPCLSSINTCLEASCYPCIGAQRDFERRRHRNRSGRSNRGRPELSFDFYDDWDEDESEAAGLLGGWGNDELDRLLAGSGAGQGSESQQPRKHRAMSYGSRGIRKKMALPSKDGDEEATTIPTSSVFGFLERVPWIGGRGVRYKPSAADLQENPGGRKRQEEGEALLTEDSEEGEPMDQRQGRPRSSTNASRSTNNSLSSRGDLFPSEDEDDAVPLDDEFAMALGSRITRTTSGDAVSSGGHSKPSSRKKRPSASRASTKTASSKDTTKSPKSVKTPDGLQMADALVPVDGAADMERGLPSVEDLQEEEERVRAEEEAEVERKREAAYRLALERGLPTGDSQVLMVRNTLTHTFLTKTFHLK